MIGQCLWLEAFAFPLDVIIWPDQSLVSSFAISAKTFSDLFYFVDGWEFKYTHLFLRDRARP